MEPCIATTRKYNHKAERLKMSKEEVSTIMYIAYKQFKHASNNEPIDCAGDNCERRLILIHMFRCWFCGRYFCPVCAKGHFGDRE